MISPVFRFYEAIPEGQSQTDTELVSFFLYFVTVEQGKVSATSKEIGECFEQCDLRPPSRLPQLLSEGTKGRTPRYIKSAMGYRLHRTLADRISSQLGCR